jgi:hypothetical protein
MQFDATNPYHRYRLHYESDHQLSVPELIARGSVAAPTAGLLWHLLEHRASYIIAGPTDPTPGVGKTTTLNALLPFYPTDTAMVYTLGLYEDFAFMKETTPTETTVLANEVSNHLPIYMWGRGARKFLCLPAEGYTIATTCHADTLADVMDILTSDLRLTPQDIHQLQVIVNIGLWGRTWPQKRRWLTTHFLTPDAADGTIINAQPISRWEAATDTFSAPDPTVVAAMARWAGESPEQFGQAVQRKTDALTEWAAQKLTQEETIAAVQAFRATS